MFGDYNEFIYFLLKPNRGRGLIKIGRSWNPYRRMEQLSRRHGILHLLAVYKIDSHWTAINQEAVLLRYFTPYRIGKTEWFYPNRVLGWLIFLGQKQYNVRGEQYTVAKRFTDTEKWAKPHFHDLDMRMKLVWIYICDNCDHAGIWDVNMKLLSFQIGIEVTVADINNAFGQKVQWLDNGQKLFIEPFIDFQYGALNSANRVHLSVITRLEKLGVCMGLASPLQGSKDKDKDKNKEKDKDLEKEKDRFLQFPKNKIEMIYKEYPRKEGKSAGMRRLKGQIKNETDLLNFGKAVSNYSAFCAREKRPREYIKQFSTFVGEWQDWLDPETGTATNFGGTRRTFAQMKSDNNADLVRRAREGEFDEYEN